MNPIVRSSDFLLKLRFMCAKLLTEGLISRAENLNSQERRVDGACRANGNCCNRNAAGHLNSCIKSVKPVKSTARDWNSDNGENGACGKNSAKVSRSASGNSCPAKPHQ